MSFYFTKQLRENVGKKIRKARRNKELKQVDVAVEAGMSPSYYGKIERGVVNPSLEKLIK